MSDDKHARDLIGRARRIDIYRQLNPWDLSLSGDNCPAAAESLFHFLAPAPGQRTSITRALPPNDGGYVYGPGVRFRRASLPQIVRMVRTADPGTRQFRVHDGALFGAHPVNGLLLRS